MFQPELETMSRDALEGLQLARLRTQLARVYVNVPLYRRKFDEAGFRPEQLESLADLARVPFTVKNDLREAYPFDMFAVPLRDIVRVHSSSGTTGQVSVVGYTRGDVERWSDLMARTLACAGRGLRGAGGGGPGRPTGGRARARAPAGPPTTGCRSPTGTGCSPAASAPTTAPSASAR